MGKKDLWNSVGPRPDAQFDEYVAQPELARPHPGPLPGRVPEPGRLHQADRADLEAILLTGIPNGIIPGFQNFTGADPRRRAAAQRGHPADQQPEHPRASSGGDLAGYPNGRRVFDDVFTIELRAIAGATIPLVDPTFTPDGAAAAVTDGVTPPGNVSYMDLFPFLDIPKSGFDLDAGGVIR